jgi:hypothetical protein
MFHGSVQSSLVSHFLPAILSTVFPLLAANWAFFSILCVLPPSLPIVRFPSLFYPKLPKLLSSPLKQSKHFQSRLPWQLFILNIYASVIFDGPLSFSSLSKLSGSKLILIVFPYALTCCNPIRFSVLQYPVSKGVLLCFLQLSPSRHSLHQISTFSTLPATWRTTTRYTVKAAVIPKIHHIHTLETSGTVTTVLKLRIWGSVRFCMYGICKSEVQVLLSVW